jgi:hypothetical protein
MTNQPLIPDPSVDERLVGNLRRARLEMAALDPQLDELLARFDELIQHQRQRRSRQPL